jgi:hypothetical protein
MTILVILGLFLLILLTVLLVPVRYTVAVTHGEELRLEGGAGWLLHLFGVKFSYIEEKFHIRIRALCFVLYDNRKPGHPKIKKKRQRATVKRKKSSGRRTKVTSKRKETASDRSGQTEILQADTGKPKLQVSHEAEINENKRIVSDSDTRNADSSFEEELRKEKESVFQRIYHKIIRLKEKIIALFQRIKSKIIKWFDTAVNIKQKVSLISDFVKDEYNKEGFSITFESLKKLLKHMMPTKLESRIVFGTGDPCTTGQALGFLGTLYSFYGAKVQIIPDFENKILEGKHYAKGRIRLITVLIIVVKLLLDKRFKQLKSNFDILKEAL